MQELKRMFNLPVILVSNKADTGEKYKGALAISAKEGQGIDKLKEKIRQELR